MEYWDATDIWLGDTVVIVGGGPSVDRMRGLLVAVRDSGARVIAINDSYRIAPWADLLYFADRQWWDGPHGRAADVRRMFLGDAVTCSDAPVARRLKNTGIEGYDGRVGRIRTGNNSGYQAMHLAIQAGARRLILMGFDMRVASDGTHHWGDRPESVQPADFHRTLQEQMLPLFSGLRSVIAECGVKIWNASPGSALNLWPIVEQAEAIRILQAGRE